MTDGMLAQIDEALATEELRELREAIEAALAGVQDVDDDGELLRLTPAQREAAFEAVLFGGGPLMTKELLAAYTHVAGLSLGADDGSLTDIFSPDEFIDVNNEQPRFRQAHPSVVLFASDGGDGFYGVDVDGSKHGVVGAALWIDRHSTESKVVAPSLPQFLCAAATSALSSG